jgi:transcriptional antiterminator NusG
VTQMGEAMHEQLLENGGFLQPSRAVDLGEWFAVQTRPRHEKKVASELQEKDVTVFLPTHTAVHQWSDRRTQVELPLFPNYVFVRLRRERRTRIPVLQTNGVVGFVGMRGAGVPIPDEQIQAVRTILSNRIPFTLCPFLSVGQIVKIRGGSLDGVQGVLVALNKDKSLIVSVESIQRSLAIRIAGYQVDAA